MVRIFSLDFIPLAGKDHDLLLQRCFKKNRRFKILMELTLLDKLDMGDYNAKETGRIKYINR